MGTGTLRRIGLAGLLVLTLGAGLGPIASATTAEQAKCSCLVNDEDDQLGAADVVFKGVYEGSTSSASQDRDGETRESGIVRHFTAFESYKGDVRPDIAAVDLSEGCGDGVGGTGGETTYLVYAEHPNGAQQKKYDLAESDLVLQPCSGTREIDRDDEPSFGPGKRVVAADEPETAPPLPAEPEEGDQREHSLSVLGDLLGDLLDGLLGNLRTPDDADDPAEEPAGDQAPGAPALPAAPELPFALPGADDPEGDGFQLLELGNLGDPDNLPGAPSGGEGGAPGVTVPELGGLPGAPPPPGS